MKIICLQENLKNGLNATERIIGKNLTLPVLNNILLKTDKGKLKISSTNLEVGINYWILGKIEKEGEITVPAKILSGLINQLPNEKIEIETKDDIINLKCKNYKAKIKGLAANEFPIIPKVQSQAEIKVGKDQLKIGLSQVAGMSAVSEIRPEISGVLFIFNKNSLKLVATDSFRLAEKTIFLKNGFEGQMIVPQRTALELARLLSEKTSGEEKGVMANILFGAGQAMFDLGYVQLVSRLIDGQYPDYRQIIPTSFQTKITIEKEELLKNIRLASLFSSKINDIQLKVFPQKKLVEIFSQNIDIGENVSHLKADIEGKQTSVAFNWRYLSDGLNNISDNKVFWGLNGETAPSVLKPIGDETYTYVVMPIRAA